MDFNTPESLWLSKNLQRNVFLEDDFTIESDLQRVYNYEIYPSDSKRNTNKIFVKIVNGEQGESHRTCFIVKVEKCTYFDSFGGSPDKFLLKHLPKPVTYQNFKIRDQNNKLCGNLRSDFSM